MQAKKLEKNDTYNTFEWGAEQNDVEKVWKIWFFNILLHQFLFVFLQFNPFASRKAQNDFFHFKTGEQSLNCSF